MTGSFSAGRKVAAWLVHLYTASGLAVGFLALQAIEAGNPRNAFLWMLLAVLIDATDGGLARLVDVKRVLPGFDGGKLDDIVDYFNYVLVPVIFLYVFKMVPESGTLIYISFPVLASAYGFCQAEAKTEDAFFTGFPSYWNILVFYLHASGCSQTSNALLLIVFSLLVFVPIRYVYPSRTPFCFILTNALGVIWTLQLFHLLWNYPQVNQNAFVLSLIFPLYYSILSFYLHLNTRKKPHVKSVLLDC